MTNVRDQGAKCREIPRSWWHDDLRDLELVGDLGGVHGPGAAVGEEHEVPGIVAAADGDLLDGADHASHRDAHDAVSRTYGVQAGNCGGERSDRLKGWRLVHRHTAAELEVWGQASQDHIGIGYRRLDSTRPVARRPRACSRAARPHLENAPGVDPGDASAARTDATDVYLRRSDGIALDELIGRD